MARNLVPHRLYLTGNNTVLLPLPLRGRFLLQTGQLHTYLAAVPVISSTWGSTLAYCTSLQELAVMDVTSKGSQRRITIPTEPAFLAIGPHHLAVGMNNKVGCTKHWHHDVLPSDNEQVSLSMIHMTDMNVIISVFICWECGKW